MNIEHAGFADDEARTRVRALADYMSTKHGCRSTGPSDSFHMKGKYKVVSIDAIIQLTPGKIAVTGKDPGMLWRGPAKAYIAKKLEQYLDPSATPESLRRA